MSLPNMSALLLLICLCGTAINADSESKANEDRRSWTEEDGVEVEIIKKIPGTSVALYYAIDNLMRQFRHQMQGHSLPSRRPH